MKSETQHTVAAAAVGVMAGMRSLSAPALVAHTFAHDGARARGRLGRALSSATVARTLETLAVGEAVADKTPWVPDRVDPLPLAGRAVSGALAGAAMGSDRRARRSRLAMIGAAAAVASTLVAFRVRRGAARTGTVSAVAAGLLEDALVVALGAGVSAWRRRR